MLIVSELYIYPIKSLGGISLTSAKVTDRGFQYDRRWMLVDEQNQFMSQRTFAEMALLKVSLSDAGLVVQHKKRDSRITIPFGPEGKELRVKVWSNVCKAIEVSEEINKWFSEVLSINCRLVYMPDESIRRVDTRYATNKEITSLSDGYPFTIIGQSSLDDLNNKLSTPIPINRFRPNIVFTGGLPFEEDTFADFTINGISFFGVKLIARCVVTTIDQEEATPSKEPLKTLSTYRQFNKKVYFGQNLLHEGEGVIKVGYQIGVFERKKARFNVI